MDQNVCVLRQQLAELKNNLTDAERNLKIQYDLLNQRGKSMQQLQSETNALSAWSQKYLEEATAVNEESGSGLSSCWLERFKQNLKTILLGSIFLALIIGTIIGIILNFSGKK